MSTRQTGMRVAVLAAMANLMRYSLIVLGVLVVVVVLTVCGGTAACSGCLSACCGRVDRTDNPRQLAGRVLDACAKRANVVTPGVAPLFTRLVQDSRGSGTWITLAPRMAELRI